MFCPDCGAQNLDDVKFCTRCGTNLEVVSNALSGRITSSLETDDRTVALLKDYYRSRRMMIIGGAASIISLFKLTLLLLLGFPDKLVPLTILVFGLLTFGFLALIWGLMKWNNASSEMKALGISPPKRPKIVEERPKTQINSGLTTPIPKTDPISIPASITEQTTHLLDD
jgi:zinc ribbon protein